MSNYSQRQLGICKSSELTTLHSLPTSVPLLCSTSAALPLHVSIPLQISIYSLFSAIPSIGSYPSRHIDTTHIPHHTNSHHSLFCNFFIFSSLFSLSLRFQENPSLSSTRQRHQTRPSMPSPASSPWEAITVGRTDDDCGLLRLGRQLSHRFCDGKTR